MHTYATLFLRNLVFSGKHGCEPKERVKAQPFLVDLEMKVDIAKSVQSDRLNDTYDYARARGIVRDVIEKEEHALIEVIASEIARRIRRDPKILGVTVELTKLHFSDNGVSGIRLSDPRR